jgi:hypothetical protein
VKLTVNGTTFTQPLTLKMDPRATITPAGLAQQFALATQIVDMMNRSYAEIRGHSARDSSQPAVGSPQSATRNPQYDALVSLNTDLATAYDVVEGADRAPTTQAFKAVTALQQRLRKLLP